MLTPLDQLTDEEKKDLAALREEAANPALLDVRLSELVISRRVLSRVRRVMRCQPPDVIRLINRLPHQPRSNFVEHKHD